MQHKQLVVDSADIVGVATKITGLIEGNSEKQGDSADDKRVASINRLHKEIETHFGVATKNCLYTAYRIGLVVLDAQAKAPRKKKTEAVRKLASHEDLCVSQAQLYRYKRLAEVLPGLVGIDPQEFIGVIKNRSAFCALVGSLSLTEAWKLICGNSSEISDKSIGSLQGGVRKKKKRSESLGDAADHERYDASARLEDDEWITPSEIVACATDLLGSIDLDPCGGIDPAFHIQASQTLTRDSDALRDGIAWKGRLFVHPPLSRVDGFSRRLHQAVSCREAHEGVLLLPAEMDAAFMPELQRYTKAFFHQRPQFALPFGEIVVPPWAYMVVFVTLDSSRDIEFAKAFGGVADIYFPYQL